MEIILGLLITGIKITLTDLRVKEEDGSCKQEVFYSVEGLKEFVRYIDSVSYTHLIAKEVLKLIK